MSSAYERIPVTVLTGFLGSGKSTLLSDILTGEVATDTAVLVNEFGAVGLDHLLIREVDSQTVLLDNGCVCCSIKSELKEALLSLFSKRARGEVPPFSRVVLETTGIATPAPIMATLLADPLVCCHYVLSSTITMIDAVNGAFQMEKHPEWTAQVTAADRIVISKSDLASEEEVRHLVSAAGKLNPAATCLIRKGAALLVDARPGERSDVVTLHQLLMETVDPLDLVRRIGADRSAKQNEFAFRAIDSAIGNKLNHRVAADAAAVQAFCLEFDESLDWSPFMLWLTMVLHRHGDKILRIKGILALSGSDSPVVLHAVQHLVHPLLHLSAWPDNDRRTRIVFITEGITHAQIEDSYRGFQKFLDEAVA